MLSRVCICEEKGKSNEDENFSVMNASYTLFSLCQVFEDLFIHQNIISRGEHNKEQH